VIPMLFLSNCGVRPVSERSAPDLTLPHFAGANPEPGRAATMTHGPVLGHRQSDRRADVGQAADSNSAMGRVVAHSSARAIVVVRQGAPQAQVRGRGSDAGRGVARTPGATVLAHGPSLDLAICRGVRC